MRARSRPRRLAWGVEVALHLVRTELSSRHRGSALGALWALGPPLLQLVATYFLFTRVIPLDIPDYPVFLLVGILAWTWFSRSLGDGVSSLEQRRELALRPGFASELVPVTSVLVALVDYLLALPVLVVALLLTTGIHPEAALLPVLLAIQLLYCAGLVLAVAPLQVFLRDVRQIVGLAISVGFWLTPVFYGLRQVPDSLAWIYEVNPMAHLIGAQREILMEGTLPDPGPLAVVTVVGLLVLAGGWLVFHRCRDSVPENL
jgi:ABC-type polysaccharide/polyol phosphate export permease